MIRDSAELEWHSPKTADGAAQVFVGAWASIGLDKWAAFFGGADPMVMQVVVSVAHIRRVPAQFSGATPISIPRGSKESGTPPGCKTPPAPLPGGRRPQITHGDFRLPSGKPFGLPDPECPHSRALSPTSWSADILPTQMEANPEGCQTVAGGRSGQRGERPPESLSYNLLHPGEGCQIPGRASTVSTCATP